MYGPTAHKWHMSLSYTFGDQQSEAHARAARRESAELARAEGVVVRRAHLEGLEAGSKKAAAAKAQALRETVGADRVPAVVAEVYTPFTCIIPNLYTRMYNQFV